MIDQQHPQSPARQLRYAVIGAGMAGLLVGIKLRQRGESNFTIYEKGDSVGGTWRENRYPGLTCDVPAHNYSYSFAPNPDWSMTFAPGPEIHRYFDKAAEDYAVREHIRLNCEATACRYRDGKWEVALSDGSRDIVDVVIAATGVLHHPNIPSIPGIENFAGKAFHSARWDDTATLDGARVGIMGSGSTGVQLVTALAGRAERLVHLNRTPQWIMPAPNAPFSDAQRAEFRADAAKIEAVRNDPRIVEFFEQVVNALVDADSPFLAEIQKICQQNLDTVKDPALRKRLRPNHRAACKRLVLSASYYAEIQRDNVVIETAPLERMERDGVRMHDGGFHPLDVLVLATGFKVDRFVRPMSVIGVDGADIDKIWGRYPTAYLSMTVPGFPNFFMLNGPTGPVGNGSLIAIAEQEWGYIDQLIAPIRRGNFSTVEVRAEILADYEKRRKQAARKTIWATGCKSWYLDDTGLPANWPWTFKHFSEEMSKPRLEEYSFT